MKYKSSFNIGSREINFNQAPYFIADIAANHDGSLSRAIDLINLCAEAGADARIAPPAPALDLMWPPACT